MIIFFYYGWLIIIIINYYTIIIIIKSSLRSVFRPPILRSTLMTPSPFVVLFWFVLTSYHTTNIYVVLSYIVDE